MKQELQELVALTELFIYDSYPLSKKSLLKPPIAPQRLEPIKQIPSLAAQPAIKEAEREKKETEPPAIEAEPKKERDFSDIERIFTKDLGYVKLHKSLPSDLIAVQKATEWKLDQEKPIVLIISSFESEKEFLFLQNVAQAIELSFGKVSIVKEFNDSLIHPNLKFCIANKAMAPLFKQKNLASICFDKISDYFVNPGYKAILWKAIIDQLSCL